MYGSLIEIILDAIIGTFQEKSAETFWRCVTKLPLQEHRIVAWKFCHVLHKVLREGHPNVLASSQRHKTLLQDLGKLWVLLKLHYFIKVMIYSKMHLFIFKGSSKRWLWKTHSTVLSIVTCKIRFSSTKSRVSWKSCII